MSDADYNPPLVAGIPTVDGCQIIGRTKLFVTQLGVLPVLRHTLRDSRGNPIDLTPYVGTNSESEDALSDQLFLRSKEVVSPASTCNPVKQVAGKIVDPTGGVVEFTLEADAVAKAGVYQVSIALHNQTGTRVYVDNPLLLVEKSLFPLTTSYDSFDQGPPSLQEIREALMDSGAGDNLLLDNVEFSDDQIASAFARPIRQWNETPPPLRPLLDTRDFPFHEAWLKAICGHLLVIAAHNYRRNRLPYSAGGISVDDKSKEPEYLRAGQALLEEYRNFVLYKKVQINTELCAGYTGSMYGGLFH